MNTNADITLYQKWYDRTLRQDRWVRVQLYGVSWYGGQAVTVGQNGLLTADKYIVRIPLTAAPAGRQHVLPEQYAEAEAADLAGLWTLQAGGIVVRGLLTADITAPAQVTGRSDSFVILGVSDNRRGSSGMQHWKVVGA